jgi:hypothetical protein
VRKVVSSGVRRVPSAFNDNLFVEAASQKGSCFWPLLRFNFRENFPSSSENEFVDIHSFSDAAPKVWKDVVPDTAAEPPVTATAAVVSQPVHPRDEATPEFTKELELTVHRGEDPVQGAPLLEICEIVPEGQAPSPSLATFNKSFGTPHRGELLSVGFEAASIGSGASKILTLWKLPTLVDETGEGSEQTGGVARESGKGPHSAQRKTSASLGKPSFEFGEEGHHAKSKQTRFVSFHQLFVVLSLRFLLMISFVEFFRVQGSPSFVSSIQTREVSRGLFS